MPDINGALKGKAELTNAIGLHARPSVKLTQLAKSFQSSIELATDAAGPWVDAKSPVKVMRVKAPKGTVLHFAANGPDAETALSAILGLIEDKFGEE
ncbi:HPr family phosphocarrier protein [Labrys sp. KB_33_2]|uniref:HPr family phosphocarrier protein n=1 Tax=Labrys sp. KB_33_2 TaxID=3237479 RepID=UPI003F8E1A19